MIAGIKYMLLILNKRYFGAVIKLAVRECNGKTRNQYYKEKRAKEEQMAERELTDSEKIFQEERAKRLNKVFKGQRSVPDPRADWDFGKGPESPPTVQYTRTELEAQQKKAGPDGKDRSLGERRRRY